MMTTFAVATPHALIILTVSHDLLFRQPPSFAATLSPPFLLTELPSHRLPSHRLSLKRTARRSMAQCIRYGRRRSLQ
jgi:hypothetical protein